MKFILILPILFAFLPQSFSYELKAVRFEGHCQVWYQNDQGKNSQRVQVYFFYDPAPLLVEMNWRTERKFVFIHPEIKQLFQLNQASIIRARSTCNIGDDALQMPLANQTIFRGRSNGYNYNSNWDRYDGYRSRFDGRETFDESIFQQNQVARFLNPNGTEQYYQIWRDKTNRGQCKATLVFQRLDGLISSRQTLNQISFPSNTLRSLRTYPLYNCIVASYSCKSYHIFLVNEDDMSVYEVNIVEESNYVSRWDMLPSSALGQFWTNGSFFPERRKYYDSFSDHCSYTQDFLPLTPQELGKNKDIARPIPPTEENIVDSGIPEGEDTVEDDNGTDGNNAIVVRPNGRNGNGNTGQGNGRRTTNNGGNTNNIEGTQQVADGFTAVDNDEADNQEDNSDGDNANVSNEDGIEVNTGSKINISGANAKGDGKFTFDDNNSISISAGKWQKGGSRPKISMNRQTNIKLGRRRRK